MGRTRVRSSRRFRVGQVSYYRHHGSWYIYYREGQRQVRRGIGTSEAAAEQTAAQLATSMPTMFSFVPITAAT